MFHQKKNFQCNDCSFSSDLKHTLVNHITNAHLKEKNNHSCTLCSQKFSIKRDLIIHTLRYHKNSTNLKKLDSDSKSGPSANNLKAELRFPFKCSLCTIGFSREDHLKRHVEAVHEKRNHLIVKSAKMHLQGKGT